MATFTQTLAARSNAPVRVVTLPLSAWASQYQDRPAGDVQIGLRRYAEGEAVRARAAASQIAWKLHPERGDSDARDEAYNGLVMAKLVAWSCCDPRDVSISYFGTATGIGAEDVLPLALSPKGIEWLFGELDALLTEEGPTAPEADDDDLAWLSGALAEGKAWGRLPANETRAVRRLLARAIYAMRGEE